MKVAMVVGALLFNLVVTGLYQMRGFDPGASPETSAVQSFEDTMPPPSSWP